MTQLVINGITLPESSGGKYKCYEGTLSDQIDMISGRRVTEVRGHVWCIECARMTTWATIWRVSFFRL